MGNDFKLGDKVTVTNLGKIYTTYEEWARLHGLTGWTWGDKILTPLETQEFTVVARGKHLSTTEIIVAIQASNGRTFIIGESGVTLAPKRYTWEEIKKKPGVYQNTGNANPDSYLVVLSNLDYRSKEETVVLYTDRSAVEVASPAAWEDETFIRRDDQRPKMVFCLTTDG